MINDELKVLAIDDDEESLSVLKTMFDSALPGNSLFLARTGLDGIKAALEHRPDVILCDIKMPGLDGFEVCRRLKADDRLKNIPVVFLTGAGTEKEKRIMALEAGGEGFLDKNLEQEELVATIRSMARLKAANEVLARAAQAEALRQGEERFAALFEEAPLPYQSLDQNGKFLEVNAAWCETLGYEKKEVLGRWFGDFLAPEQVAVFRERFPVFKSKGKISVEFCLVRKDGRRIYAAFDGRIAYKPDGTFRQTHCILQDITERKRQELYVDISREALSILNASGDFKEAASKIVAALKTRGGFDAVGLRLQQGEDFPYLCQDGFPEDFLLTENTLVERAADGGLCRDKDGKICLACTCGLVISGKPSPELTKGGSFWTNDSFPLLDLPAEQDPRLHPRNNCIHKNYASVALVPIRGKAGIVGLLQLNSHKKNCFTEGIIAQLENMAASIGEALMRKRAEAERETLRMELLQSQKMESIGRLAGGMAHDFNNILTAIGGYAGFLFRGLAEDDPRREDAKEILNAAERAAALTRQLLAFSRKQILAPQQIDINATLAGTVNMLRRLIGEDVKLEVKPAKRPCMVNVDPGQLSQVLMNLAVNARDAMPEGGTIVIEAGLVKPDKTFFAARPGLKPGPLVRLSFSDTGCGISPENKKHLFEPFFTTKEKGKGTGLGLATVYGIVKQSGGDIEVESAPGHGTTFHIYLPQVAEAAPGKEQAEGKIELQRGTETILLVDDEETLRRLSERFLRAAGYTVISAADGLAAIAAAESYGKPVDLLLTDVVMPGMNGRELARRLADARLAARTLYMSGYTDEAVIKHGVLEPGIAFIYKPFSVEALTAKVREALDGPADKAKP